MGKPMVSKSAYAQAQTKRAVLQLLGTLFIFLMIFCGCITATAGSVFVIAGIGAVAFGCSQVGSVSLVSLFVTLFCAAATYGCWRVMEAAATQADNIHPGVPITRANSAYLSAQDSLVRASVEPVQTQETVLLRPTKEEPDKHEDQLVRAVGGQE